MHIPRAHSIHVFFSLQADPHAGPKSKALTSRVEPKFDELLLVPFPRGRTPPFPDPNWNPESETRGVQIDSSLSYMLFK